VSESSGGIGIRGLDHVQLAMPAGGEAAARSFYGDLLGLLELPKPPELAGRGGCWFDGDGVTIHLGVEEPFVPARKAHPALLVADLGAAVAALRSAGATVVDDDSGLPVRRCYTADPFGNRIELIDMRDSGFSDRAR
jgi:catechol 2,3-dioxygenase-like lactoylglutathione lyase family enzyme